MTWPVVPLEEVATIERSGIDPKSLESETPYVGLENIKTGGELTEVTNVKNGDLKSTKFIFGSNHILYGKLRPYLAKIALPSFSGICSTDILPILPGSHIDRGFLCHYLRQPSLVDFATSRAEGVNLPRLSPKTLAKFKIPLPPLEEQKRIAAILDKADQLRQKRRQAIALLDSLTQSIFVEMFGEETQTRKLAEVASIRSGSTPSRSDVENFGGSIPWVKTTEVKGKVIHFTDETVTQKGATAARLKTFQPGTILMAMYGQGTTRGNVAILGIPATINQACAAIEPEGLDETFLFHQLKLKYNEIRSMGRGGNQPNLNLEIVGSIDIKVPDSARQQDFKQAIERINHWTDQLILSSEVYESLFASLQFRAFAGEL
ncbi:restriction endonuclease subunit S [Martelella mediterranea]|uniref:EcoKI restriction-modification system protein HsdS n=1 Tax=Martelella mediterranea DSM 17316 TaxID=1122214 RepID=A0A1U9Z0A4_9HYPH|nr:restriction endonuclease subunit S [Martelella mediterranea]AQZ51119.1 EcoKI restriction-modification system protein HsdS [Martelella mediterranea DSM 17316]